MTFQKQLGMEQTSKLTNSMIFQRGRYTTNQSVAFGTGLESTGTRMSKWVHLLFPAHNLYGYGSTPINTIFRGMNIHLPAILMFTRGTRF